MIYEKWFLLSNEINTIEIPKNIIIIRKKSIFKSVQFNLSFCLHDDGIFCNDSNGSLSFSSTSTSGGGSMAAVASQKEHQHYPPSVADPQQHHAHSHAHHQAHHQDGHSDSVA